MKNFAYGRGLPAVTDSAAKCLLQMCRFVPLEKDYIQDTI